MLAGAASMVTPSFSRPTTVSECVRRPCNSLGAKMSGEYEIAGVAFREPEIGRHHADDREWRAGQRDRLADEAAVAAEPPLPELVPQHDDAIAALSPPLR